MEYTGLQTRQKQVKGIPKPIKLFLFKVAGFYVTWSLLYAFVLQPHRIIDADLTRNLGTLTAATVQLLLPNHAVKVIHDAEISSLFVDGKLNIYILDGCNGFELYVLYVGFILCFPFKNKSTISYITLGLAGIFLVNLLRCTVLSYLRFHEVTYFNIIHHYIFTVVVYGFICALWYRYLMVNLHKAGIKSQSSR